MSTDAKIQVLSFVVLFGSIVLHEVTHGWVALGFGDATAKEAGRLSLNPLVHVDPIGTVLLPALLVISNASFIFGWAKPVPVNTSRMRDPRNGALVTGLAGPAMNLVLVALAAVVFRVLHPEQFWVYVTFYLLGLTNLWLAIFNLIPLPPLDGSAVIERMLPERLWAPYLSIRPYTLVIVMAVVIVGGQTGATSAVFGHLANWWQGVVGYPVYY